MGIKGLSSTGVAYDEATDYVATEKGFDESSVEADEEGAPQVEKAAVEQALDEVTEGQKTKS